MLYYLAISKSMLIFEVNITKDPNELTDRFNELKSDLNKWKTKLNQLDNIVVNCFSAKSSFSNPFL